MRTAIILFLLLLLLFFLPISLKTKILFNVIENKGCVSVYFYKIKLIVSKWRFVPFKIVVESNKKEETSIYFNKPNKDNNYKDIFFNQVIRRVRIKNFRTYAKLGFNENCLVTAISVGLLKIMSALLNCFLLKYKVPENLKSQIFCDFKNTNFFLCLTSSVQLNLFMIVESIITSFFIKFYKGR